MRAPLFFVAFVTVVASIPIAGRAAADGPYHWRVEPGEEHGSQVASSEWLPILIGGSAGLVVGGLVGAEADSSRPPVAGPLIGGALGGIAGGGAGAWFIRQTRAQDTRFAGAATGFGVGGGIGAVLLAQTDQVVGKVLAVTLLPAIGAIAGHRLAVYLGYKQTPSDSTIVPPRIAFRPVATPVQTAGYGTTGITFGIDGVFF